MAVLDLQHLAATDLATGGTCYSWMGTIDEHNYWSVSGANCFPLPPLTAYPTLFSLNSAKTGLTHCIRFLPEPKAKHETK